jgi:hypothetical protein
MAEPLLEEELDVAPAVAPRVELDLAHPGAVVDGELGAPQPLLPRLYLELLAERIWTSANWWMVGRLAFPIWDAR